MFFHGLAWAPDSRNSIAGQIRNQINGNSQTSVNPHRKELGEITDRRDENSIINSDKASIEPDSSVITPRV